MEASVGGLKRAFGVTLALTASLLLVAATWSFVALTRALALQSASVNRLVRFSGRDLDRHLAAEGYRAPDGTEILDPGGDAGGMIFLKQAVLFDGGRAVWVVPPAGVPDFPRRANIAEDAGRAGDSWYYTRRLPGERSLAAFYDVPSYERLRDGFLLLAAYETSAVLALILFWVLLAWKFHRAYTGISSSLREAGTLFPNSSPLTSVQAVSRVFEQTVQELKKRTAELDALHRKMKQRAEDVEDLAKALCANLQAGYLRFGTEGLLLDSNMEARRLLGMVEFPRRGDRESALLGDHPSLSTLLAEARFAREIVTREEVCGGAGLLLQAAAIPLSNQMGQLKGHLLILWDRTESYGMAKTLREREALSRLGEVSAGMAHEVRNALNAMTATFRLLGEDHPDLAPDPRFTALSDEIRSLEKAVRDLLYYARPLPLEKEPAEARELLGEIAAQMREMFPGVEVEVGADAAVPYADREALQRALYNLARNAAEAALSGERRPARILLEALERPEGRTTFRVGDSGAGLSAEGARLFEPFFSQKPGGTGLGLAIARKVAREHGGDLAAASPSPLGGASFELWLPKEKA